MNQWFSSFPSVAALQIATDCDTFSRIKAHSVYQIPLFSRKMRDRSGENMAYIRAYKGGFRAEVEKLGIRESRTFDTKRLAQEWGKRREIEIESQVELKAAHTFEEACTKYLAEVSSRKNGIKWEALRIRGFLAHFGDVPLASIQQPQIAEWRDTRLKTVSGGTVLREKNLLNNIFTVARQEWHWCDHRPFEGVKLPKENEEREAVWRWQEIKRVLRAPVGGKTRETVEAFHIALRTAMRLQEILAAPGLFDKVKQVVNLPPELVKTGRRETVPIGRIGAKLLQRKPFTVGANEASTLFADLTRSLGIAGLTFHDSRATALTYLARKVDVMRLAKISRHRDIRILQRRYYRERAEDISKLI